MRIDELGFYKSKCESWRELNEELKQHNAELRDSNKFLRAAHKDNQVTYYSDAVKKDSSKPKSTSCLILRSKDENEVDQAMVKQKILKNAMHPIIAMTKTPCGDLTIKCYEEDLEKLKMTLDEEVGERVQVQKEEKKDPTIRVLGIRSELDTADILSDIALRNRIESNDLNVLHTHEVREGVRNIILRVAPKAYERIMESRRIFVGYQRCLVVDEFNLRRCWRCCGYGHKGVNCNRKVACANCAGEHETKKCDNKETKACINCLYSNKLTHKQKQINHAANDIHLCDTYKMKWEVRVMSTNYPYRPRSAFFKRAQNGC